MIEFLVKHPEVERMYGDIYHFVASWLPDYARDNRNYLTVAIGCTGGRHRSVYLVGAPGEDVRRSATRSWFVIASSGMHRSAAP